MFNKDQTKLFDDAALKFFQGQLQTLRDIVEPYSAIMGVGKSSLHDLLLMRSMMDATSVLWMGAKAAGLSDEEAEKTLNTAIKEAIKNGIKQGKVAYGEAKGSTANRG